MNRVISKYRRDETFVQQFSRKTWQKEDKLQILDIYLRIILKWIFKK
jgi:hypothetical protein